MITNARRSYVALTITLTTAAQNILDVINTALALQSGAPVCPGAGREINLQADPANAATIFIGDAALTTTNYGYGLVAGSSRLYRSDLNNVQLGGIYALSGTTAQVLHVEVMQG